MHSTAASLDETLAEVHALDPLALPLLDALGCVIAQQVIAPENVPAFATVEIDGFAVRAANVVAGQVMAIVDEVPAGFRATETLEPGTCIAVTRGAPLPEGADAVVELRASRRVDDGVILEWAQSGHGFAREGSLISAGTVIASAGECVDSHLVGELSRAGIRAVEVHPHPRVLVVTVGTEFVEPGVPTPVGLVADHLSLLASALVTELGGLAFRVPPVLDGPDEAGLVIDDHAHRSDLIVLCGVGLSDAPVMAGALGLSASDSGTGDLVVHGMRSGTLVISLPDEPASLRRAALEILPRALGRLAGRPTA